MTTPTYPIGATGMDVLKSWGPVLHIGSWPLEATCRVLRAETTACGWAMGYAELHGAIDYLAIWRDVYPHIRIPAGYSVQPLMSVEDARRSGARFVRLELVSAPSPSETGKGYVLTHVQHSGG